MSFNSQLKIGLFSTDDVFYQRLAALWKDLDFSVDFTQFKAFSSTQEKDTDWQLIFVESSSYQEDRRLVNQLKKTFYQAEIVVIVSNDSYALAKRILELGVADVLQKEHTTAMMLRAKKRYDSIREIGEMSEFSKELSLSALEALPVAFYLLEVSYKNNEINDFIIRAINQCACDQLGKSRDELVGFGICDLYPINKTNGFFEQYVKVFETGEILSQQYEIPATLEAPGWFEHNVIKVDGGIVIYNHDISELVNKNFEIETRNQQLNSVLNGVRGVTLRHAINLKTLKEEIRFASSRSKDVFGFSPEQVKENVNVLWDCVHKEDFKRIKEAVLEAIEKKEAYHFQYRFTTPEGELRWIETMGEPELKDDHFIVYSVFSWDISRHKKTERELEYQRFVIDQYAAVSTCDADEIFLHVNEKFEKTFGFSSEELIGKSHTLLKSGYHSDQFYEEFYTTLRSGKVWKGEFLHKCKNGALKWFNTVVVPFTEESSELPTRYVSMSIDITSQKQNEKQLLEEKEKLSAAISGTRAGLFDWFIQENLINVNQEYADQIGVDLARLNPLTYQNFVELIHPDDKELVNLAVQKHLLGQTEFYEVEFRMKHHQGYFINLFARGKVVDRNGKDEPTRMVGTQIHVARKIANSQEENSRKD